MYEYWQDDPRTAPLGLDNRLVDWIVWYGGWLLFGRVAVPYFLPLLGWAFPGCHPTS